MGIPVRSPGRKRIKNIRHGHDRRVKGNFIAAQSIRVTRSIVPFVVMSDGRNILSE